MILLDSSKFFFPFFSVPSAQPENPIPWISNSIIHQLKGGIFKILHKDVVCTFPLDISFWHAFRVPYVFPSGTRAFLPPVSPGPSDRECSMNGRVYNSAIIQSVTTSSSSINHSFIHRNAINISISIDRSNRYLSEKKKQKKRSFLIVIGDIVSQSHDRAPWTDGIINLRIEKRSESILWRVWSFYRFHDACLLAVQVSINK